MSQGNETLCSCELSCGEDVVINSGTMNQDLCLLAQKLAEGIVIPITGEKGIDMADRAINRELKNIIIRLEDSQRAMLLHHFIYSTIFGYIDATKDKRK
jgi:hypothetical protein